MTDDSRYPSTPDLFEKAIYKDVRKLLRRGVDLEWAVSELRNISHAAREISDKSTDIERIRDVLEAAINQYADPALRKALVYWFGLAPDPEAKPNPFSWTPRLDAAHDRLGDGQAFQTFRTHEVKRICTFLARHIFEEYWRATNRVDNH
ncbi:MAG TPA: hypothetical protein VF245_05910 [Solirubrobacterales bacterium]